MDMGEYTVGRLEILRVVGHAPWQAWSMTLRPRAIQKKQELRGIIPVQETYLTANHFL